MARRTYTHTHIMYTYPWNQIDMIIYVPTNRAKKTHTVYIYTHMHTILIKVYAYKNLQMSFFSLFCASLPTAIRSYKNFFTRSLFHKTILLLHLRKLFNADNCLRKRLRRYFKNLTERVSGSVIMRIVV